jgi:hypothetical protein
VVESYIKFMEYKFEGMHGSVYLGLLANENSDMAKEIKKWI